MKGEPSGCCRRLPVGLGVLAIIFLITVSFTSGHSALGSPRGTGQAAAAHLAPAAELAPAAPSSATSVTLSISTDRPSICAYGGPTCPNGTGVGRVSLSGFLGNGTSWPNVQLAFVFDTTMYMGVYEPSGGTMDPCQYPWQGRTLCEESNGIPFLIHNMSQIASGIQRHHSGTNVSFALVDYASAAANWDDGDSSAFHVDVANFTSNTTQFSTAVNTSFALVAPNYTISDTDRSDTSLHSAAITALYGTMVTGALNWSPNTHHVIVWVGVTAPQDVNYTQNYCVEFNDSHCSAVNLTSTSCEPAYTFVGGTSPNCLGWVSSQTANSSRSLSALARQSSNCNGSLGGQCTIDTLNLWAMPTDPSSLGWPTGYPGGGPNGSVVVQNAHRILTAGCDLAHATNGTWAGPSFFACPNGVNGTLHFEGRLLANNSTNFDHPTLLTALTQVGFGEVDSLGGVPGRPMFTFVPYGNISLAPSLSPFTQCQTRTGPFPDCQVVPDVLSQGGHAYLAWNWSPFGSENVLHPGDRWSASFDIVASGGPFGIVPVDRCSSAMCRAAEVGVAGVSSGLLLQKPSGVAELSSFPLTTIGVAAPAPLTLGISITPVAPLVDEAAVFQANVAGGVVPYSYLWSFGDGSTSSVGAPAHAFTRPGTYLLTVDVTDAVGQTNHAGVSLSVWARPLVTSLSVDRPETTVGRSVQFTGSATGGYSVLSYAWNGLPEGCFSENASVLTCLPVAAGVFTVSVTVSDLAGNHQASRVSLVVNPPIQATIVSTVSPTCQMGEVAPMTLSANLTGGTPAYQLHWSFGDGATATGSFPVSHAYLHPGAYIVGVEVTDSAGASANGTAVVHATAPTACPGSSLGQRSDPTSMVSLLVIAFVVIAVALAAVVLNARRRR